MKVLITGGAGFIGCNIASKFIREKRQVIIFDNLSRQGAELNLEWLKQQGDFTFIKGDVRNFEGLKDLFLNCSDIDVVIHSAAQVAVTTSVLFPREDFEVNAMGTFNVLEAIRESSSNPVVIFASTNKVYGRMEDMEIVEVDGKYQYKNLPYGISESRSLDFHSPYGCSKGAADQYVIDYFRIYGIRTVVFRQSCVYGYRQFGIEDQGWVAWFIIASVLDKPITIYGDGKQVRDVLFIDDLVDALQKSIENIDRLCGKIYNIGGGPKNQLSPLELIDFLQNFLNKKIKHSFGKWRPGDQLVFVSDIRKAKRDFGWVPRVATNEGLEKLVEWVEVNRALFSQLS